MTIKNINSYEQAIQTDPNNWENYWGLGLAYLIKGQTDNAFEVWMSVLLEIEILSDEAPNRSLVKFLQSEIEEQIKLSQLENVKIIYDAILEFEEKNFVEIEDIKNKVTQITASLFQAALVSSLSQQFDQAETQYKQVLLFEPEHIYAWSNLGMIYYELGKYQEAYESVMRSLHYDDSIFRHHFNLGMILEKLGQLEIAKQAYTTTIDLNPLFFDAYNALAVIEKNQGSYDNAICILQKGLDLDENHFAFHVNLGNVYFSQGKFTEAIEAYEKALNLKRRDPDILFNIGKAYEMLGDEIQANLHYGFSAYRREQFKEAITYFLEVLSSDSDCKDGHFYVALADCYSNLNLVQDSIEICKKGILVFREYVSLYRYLFSLYERVGQIEEAFNLTQLAKEIFPQNYDFQRLAQVLLPIVYTSVDEIADCRSRFLQSLEQLIETTKLDTLEDKKNAMESINLTTNYYLHYQNYNDLDIQVKYGRLVHRIMATNFPEWNQDLAMPPLSNKKIRIGFVSQRFQKGFSRLFMGWYKDLNREQFEIYSYDLETPNVVDTPEYKVLSHAYYSFSYRLEDACQQIYQDNLHILIYFDIGLDPGITQMAALRLAPVQCVTWGHPITTGLPTIDYFLGSDAMEPPNAQEHYSEKLIRLNHLGFSVANPPQVSWPITHNRSHIEFEEEDIIYFSCQHITKYLPQYDYLFAEIATRVNKAKFAFVYSYQSNEVTHQLMSRIGKVFQSYGLDPDNYIRILHRLNMESYFNVLRNVDVFLDTIGWSGGLTSIDAIACNLPIVTLPGEFMRGRQSAGMLNIIGVTETIAKNEQDYIDIAVKLGLNKEYKQSIIDQMSKNHHLLFEDKQCSVDLENFIKETIRDYPVNVKH